MSGLPPPGMRHLATTRRDAKSITEIDPSRRFDTYRDRASRDTCRPCAPWPVGMNWRTLVPSGVKYRLYGYGMLMVRDGRPVWMSITVRLLEPSFSTYSSLRSHAGEMWWGICPTEK